jgi:hypothetical protein
MNDEEIIANKIGRYMAEAGGDPRGAMRLMAIDLHRLGVDFLPSRKGSKPLTSPTRPPRKLPRLYRDGSDVFLWMPDGTTVPLEPLEVSILVENISSVASGAYVYEKTRIKLDADG